MNNQPAEFEEGDRVRIDIPDEADRDHHLHGRHGSVDTVIKDDLDKIGGKEVDSTIYRIDIDGEMVDLRGRDVRPPIE
ncbi:hypothetical protein HTSR_0932 [Halodesulfurarchaeum formicicum]|uniref:DUF8139 domain-containing protein n=1 Tax=Halodesulfurarchaeum formicicum TaxID=1873524 RepID=A0A1D8S439_9EURY|nr:hypothetical protein [Halodesulfurarchaeum formicicum]AOW80117.1 hypothetical protein HTSR_0932 [Halodesulfurarchaeum formicicum]